MSTNLLRRIGVTVPIIQAPMAGVSTPLLASKVSNFGGLGSLGLGASTPSAARKSILELRQLLDHGKPFHVNLFVHQSLPSDSTLAKEELDERRRKEERWIDKLSDLFNKYGADPPKELKTIYKSFAEDENPDTGNGGGEMMQVLLDTKPTVISFHFGLPSPSVIAKLKENGAILLASATCISEAQAIEEAGLDGIIAQGYEAGGHRGIFHPNSPTSPDDRLGTFSLVRLLVQRGTTLPVIAAGGIMDGSGIKAALALGATAVQLGTAFIACPESSADQGYRKLLLEDQAAWHTIMTDVVSGRPARALPNKFTDLMHRLPASSGKEEKDHLQTPDYPRAYDVAKALHAAAKEQGEYGYGAYWAGQGAPLARSLQAEELMSVLVKEWKSQ